MDYGNEKKNEYFNYHLKQYEVPYRSTVSFIDFIRKSINTEEASSVIDVGCGGGANVFWMTEQLPEFQFTGVDIDEQAIELASDKNPKHQFQVSDFTKVTEEFEPESYDYVFASQFIITTDFDLYFFLEKAKHLGKKGIFLTGLFSEGYIEQFNKCFDSEANWEFEYKIYSLPKMADWLKEKYNAEVTFEPFEIDMDIPKPKDIRFGTYTEKLESGKRLQISGYMVMPWYNVFIKF